MYNFREFNLSIEEVCNALANYINDYKDVDVAAGTMHIVTNPDTSITVKVFASDNDKVSIQ